MTAHTLLAPRGFDINEDKGPYLARICSVMIVISAIAVVLRFLSRRVVKAPLLWDDWVILLAMVCDSTAIEVSSDASFSQRLGRFVRSCFIVCNASFWGISVLFFVNLDLLRRQAFSLRPALAMAPSARRAFCRP